MIDFSRIYCKSHPYEIITNFCSKQECLTGLCATCVCTHNNFHMLNQTNADYQNIRFTYSQMHQRVRNQIQDFDNDKVRISGLRLNIQKKKNQIRSSLIEARKQCLQSINDYFDHFTKEVNQMVESESIKSGYHSQQRLDNLSIFMTKQINKLIESAEQLNSKDFLANIKPIKKQVLPHSALAHRQISYQLQENQAYTPKLQINFGVFNEIQLCLKKMFLLKFEYPIHRHPRILQYQINSIENNNQHKFINQFVTQKSLDLDVRTRDSFFKTQNVCPLSVSKIYTPQTINNQSVTFNKLPTTVIIQNPSIFNRNLSVAQNLSLVRVSNSLPRQQMSNSFLKVQSRGNSPSNCIIRPSNSILRTSNINQSYANQYSQYKPLINGSKVIKVMNESNKKTNLIPKYTQISKDTPLSNSQQIKKNQKKKLTLCSNQPFTETKQNTPL